MRSVVGVARRSVIPAWTTVCLVPPRSVLVARGVPALCTLLVPGTFATTLAQALLPQYLALREEKSRRRMRRGCQRLFCR